MPNSSLSLHAITPSSVVLVPVLLAVKIPKRDSEEGPVKVRLKAINLSPVTHLLPASIFTSERVFASPVEILSARFAVSLGLTGAFSSLFKSLEHDVKPAAMTPRIRP